MYNIVDLLRLAVNNKASDIHLKAGKEPVLRINGDLMRVEDFPRISPEEIGELTESMMIEQVKQVFREKHEADFSIGFPKLGRFRVNAYMQRGTIALALRHIPFEVPDIDSLNLPEIIKKLALENTSDKF